jgi:hypothetical protein
MNGCASEQYIHSRPQYHKHDLSLPAYKTDSFALGFQTPPVQNLSPFKFLLVSIGYCYISLLPDRSIILNTTPFAPIYVTLFHFRNPCGLSTRLTELSDFASVTNMESFLTRFKMSKYVKVYNVNCSKSSLSHQFLTLTSSELPRSL